MDGASPAHVSDGSSDQFFLPPGQRNFRLIDAERIASDRLKDAPEGSLKEALATTIVEETAPGGASLTERLADVAAADDFAALRPFQAGPDAMFGWMDAVPPAHTVPFFEAPEEIPQAAAPIVEPMPEPAAPVAARAEPLPVVLTAPLAEPMVALEPAAQAEAETDDQQLALNLLAPEHAPATADAPVAMPAVMAEPPVEMAAEDLLAMEQAFSEMATAIEERARNELGAAPHDAKLEPIVTAFAASARLAADATAASQALHHLKRLLADQLVEPAPFSEAASAEGAEYAATTALPVPEEMAPVQATIAMETPAPVAPPREEPVRVELAPPPVPRAVVPPSIPSVAAVPRATSLPLEPPHEELPQIVSKARVLAREPVREPVRAMPQPPPVMPAQRAPSPPILRTVEAAPETVKTGRKASRNLPVPVPAPAFAYERTPFDLRGFCTGFVLSGAIGLLLYFVMTAS
ncbi:MAG: hypothetical protein EKK41_29415 [Hyphomicrobiales bacterium]|nr:MAG: hypothetical protein EKK41_29415 [Hyphomicrobiales bacterium]